MKWDPVVPGAVQTVQKHISHSLQVQVHENCMEMSFRVRVDTKKIKVDWK